jgi:hypothetical protein
VVVPAAGIAASALALPLPKAPQVFCDLLGASAGPCALFAVGLPWLPRARALWSAASARRAGWLTLKLVGQPALTFRSRAPVRPRRALEPSRRLGPLTGALSFVLAQKYGIYVVRPRRSSGVDRAVGDHAVADDIMAP